jgi:hypothetical protein
MNFIYLLSLLNIIISNFINAQLTTDSNLLIKVAEEPVLQIKVPKWKPKTTDTIYDPKKIDWRSVISGCRATCRYDRRLCNFYVRASAHDSFSISEGFGGADGSVLLTADEIRRPENKYDSWAHLLAQNALALAQRFDTSVADIIAVCGAVATEFQGGPTILKDDQVQPFLVGRYDTLEPNPANKLPGSNLNLDGFATFTQTRNLTMEEMTALMGSHSLIDNRGCIKMNGGMCDPTVEACTDLRMFRWSNQYYRDVCVPNIRINNPPIRNSMPLRTLDFIKKQKMCTFTSPELRKRTADIFDTEVRTLMGVQDPNALVIDLETEMAPVSWFSMDLSQRQWFYTVHDAWMGLACQRRVTQTPINIEIGNAMNKFRMNVGEWDSTYIRAYKKMINTGANWVTPGGFAITGDECPSGYVSAVKGLVLDCSKCDEVSRRDGTYNCSLNCKCKTGMSNSAKFYTTFMP